MGESTSYTLEIQQKSNLLAAKAVSFSISTLVPRAVELIRFLELVDLHPCLYEGPAVSCAIRRYEECWLPLLAEYWRSPTGSTPLQPPLDCAWIWHCHRLNPIAYAGDCEVLYGRVLGAPSAMNTTEAFESSRRLWEESFPNEPYDLDLQQFHFDEGQSVSSEFRSKIRYNLQEAAMRQSTFYYQVSEPHFLDDKFLRAAEERYKCFLYLFKLTDLQLFLVPTYDIDIMWHAHLRDPEAYTKDLTRFLGKVLDHDDTSSDRSPGAKLQQGFQQTCRKWHECYGAAYTRAGAMYRGEAPARIELDSLASSSRTCTTAFGVPFHFRPLAQRELMQVSITIAKAPKSPTTKGKLRILLQMGSKCSSFKLETSSVPILSELEWKHTWTFHVEKSTERLKLKLLCTRSNALMQKLVGDEVIGSAYLKWQNLLSSPTLAYDGWLDMAPISGSRSSSIYKKPPPAIFISISVTPPQLGPQLFRAISCSPTDDSGRMSKCCPRRGSWQTKSVLDHTNRVVFVIRARYSGVENSIPEHENCLHIHEGEWVYSNVFPHIRTAPAKIIATAISMTSQLDAGQTLCGHRCWGFFNNSSQLTVSRDSTRNGWPLLEIQGVLSNEICLISGRKLQYEVKSATDEDEVTFVTLIRYNLSGAPLGKATALFNWSTGAMEVSPDESVALVLLLSNIISISFDEWDTAKRNAHKHGPGRRPRIRHSYASDEWENGQHRQYGRQK
ncbi:hypothetical protein KP509_30G026300 [Ceratopteris richardii]|uniref:Glycine-rich domain-containing protein 1 n=1 Tax=Ceratopteris richardii TaxID=49495 RepID=A0A8T2R0P6_CERRI|nr:hypothetical protein KP509_30G026300 [Ceratopteris richardii]